MDKHEVLRRVAEANRLLVEGRRTIYRQRDIIARLERMGIDSAKQHALLTILVEEHANREERLTQLLDRLKTQTDQKSDGQDISAQVERDEPRVSDGKVRLGRYIDSQR
jgi:hypothetical protein